MNLIRKYRFILLQSIFFACSLKATGQGPVPACSTLGQTPSTAFPVCGSTTFRQNQVPICVNRDPLFVPGCTGDGCAYADKNPFYYKFTCFVSGTLGFVVRPLAANEDYDWQLYDITGRNPNDIFTNNSLIVTGNWAGTFGNTGASAAGVNFIQCCSQPQDNRNAFAQMPNLIAGREYLLMISHFTDGQSGYDLSFGGGTAVITDPQVPLPVSVQPECDGSKLTLRLNKKVKCTTATPAGSEFSLFPAVTTITAATPDSCAFGFDFDEIVLTLAAPLTNGTYDLIISDGTDGNTLKDNCDNSIPVGERISFSYLAPQPIFADSVRRPGCATDSILVYYPKKIRCSSITASGSDFSVTGPTPVTVSAAGGNCVNDQTDYIVVRFASPVYTKGTYTLTIQPGIDGSPIFDACGQPILPQNLFFITADTVNADFTYQLLYGCLTNTVFFSHDGAHDVNTWLWTINGGPPVTPRTHSIVFPASSTNNVRLYVSNGTCSDTTSAVITFNNEVKASVDMENILCPEDGLAVTNTSTGNIDLWRWNYDVIGSSTLKDPPPFLFPTINREAYYTVKLTVTSLTLGCSDSARKTLTVLDHCFIDVPNAFTPNNDGLNDFFRPHNAIKADNYDFRVYNRWGQPVFRSRNWQEKWDGRINGVLQSTGTYVWMLSYTHRDTKQPVFRKGTVTLIR
ncbi:MAG: T9SS type B sorting domain-containing protein [Bacteroidetes bacterium]|nr:T9SS type B sorting domain-containing protein [Bacteroidota bacterium]